LDEPSVLAPRGISWDLVGDPWVSGPLLRCPERPKRAPGHASLIAAAILGVVAGLLTKTDQPRQPSFDKAAYRQRNHVERMVNRLKGWRRVATRYEEREVNYLAMVTIAAIVLLWLE
jgi:transposase